MNKHQRATVKCVVKRRSRQCKSQSFSKVISVHNGAKDTINHSTPSMNLVKRSTDFAVCNSFPSTDSTIRNSFPSTHSITNSRKSTGLSLIVNSVKPSSEKSEKKETKLAGRWKSKCSLPCVIALILLGVCFFISMAILAYALFTINKVTKTTTTTATNRMSTTITVTATTSTTSSTTTTVLTSTISSTTTTFTTSTTSPTTTTASTSTTSPTTTTVSTSTTSSTTTTVSTSTTSPTTTTISSTTTTSFLFEWNSTGITIAGITGSSGTANNQLTNPFGVTLDSSNTLFIADRGNNRVQKWLENASSGTTIAGQSNGISGTGLNYLNNPSNVNVDSSGNIYTTEVFNYRVLFWPVGASSGTLIAGNGTTGSLNNLLNQPHDIAHDWSTGILYISEYDNHRVMQYLPGALSGNVVAGGNGPGYSNTQLLNPVGLYFDSSTNSLFIANFGAHNIVQWVVGNSSWTLVAGIGGSSGSTSMLLNSPGDVTLDLMGNIYVADTSNHRIQFFWAGQSNGTTIAGVTSSPGSSSTQLNLPFGLTVDDQFNVYIADYNNHRIQKFVHY